MLSILGKSKNLPCSKGLKCLSVAFAANVDSRCGSPTILKNVLCLILQIFLFLEEFECYTTSDWLKHMV